MFKKLAAVLGVALCLTVGITAIAGAEDYKKFSAGIRAVYVMPTEKFDQRIGGLGLGGPAVSDDVTPGVDLEYFFTKNISAELFAAVTKHEISVGGQPFGSTWLLPPTLTVKFHPLAGQVISPYIGGGVNFTMPFNSKLNIPALPANDFSIDNNVGWVAQGGVDLNVTPNLFFNIDYKYVGLETKFHYAATKFDLDVNPHLFGIGVGYRF